MKFDKDLTSLRSNTDLCYITRIILYTFWEEMVLEVKFRPVSGSTFPACIYSSFVFMFMFGYNRHMVTK